MNLQQLKYVLAVMDNGSFVAAANSCSVTQPTLSNAVAQLEAELGQRIFKRSTRAVHVTHFGETVRAQIAAALECVDRIQGIARGIAHASKAVRVGLSPIVGVGMAAAALSHVARLRPETKLIYREENLEELCRLLEERQIDLAIAPVDIGSPDLADCVFALLQRDPLYFVPPSDSQARWRGRAAVGLREIAGETFVLVPDACGLTRVTKRHFAEHQAVLKRYAGEASSYRVVGEWAALGLGAGILPYSKLAGGAGERAAIPISDGGRPLTIDYYAFGRVSDYAPDIFTDVWRSLAMFGIGKNAGAAAGSTAVSGVSPFY